MPDPCDQTIRRRAVTDLTTTFLVEAGAGTGKTQLLVDRYVACLLDCGSIRRVVAITFTEKAAEELRLRVRSRLRCLIDAAQPGERRQKLTDALREIDQAPISTIHAFAGRLLRESPVEARIDPAFRQLDALGSRLLLDRLWEEWLDTELGFAAESGGTRAPGMRDLLDAGVGLEALAGVARAVFQYRFDVEESQQGRAAADLSHLADRLAGPVAALLAALEEQTAHACQWCSDEQDRGYLQAMGCAEQLDVLRAALHGGVHQLVAAVAAVKPVSSSAGTRGCWGGKTGKEAFQVVCGRVREVHADVLAVYGDAVAAAVLAAAWRFSDWAAGEQLTRGFLDFADLLGRLRNALRADRPFRERWQQAFDYLLVDEFQDTDPLQAEIVLFLAEDGARAADWRRVALKPGKLFVVGDPKQSIYRFRRADIAMYDDVKELMRAADGAVLPIQQNFRTVPSIVDWVNDRFAVAIGADAAPRRQPDYQPLAAFRPEPVPAPTDVAPSLADEPVPRVLVLCGPPAQDGSVEALRRAEAEGLAAALVEGVDQKKWRVRDREAEADAQAPEVWRQARWADVAVLLRVSTGVDLYEQALRDAGVPFRVEAGKAFYQRREVRDALLGLRAVADAADPLAVYGALHSTLFGFTDERLYLFHVAGGSFDYLAEQPPAADPDVTQALLVLRAVHSQVHVQPVDHTLAELLRRTWAFEASAAWGDASGQALRNLEKLLQKARAFASEEHPGMYAFVRWAEQQLTAADESESQPDEDADAIRIMTVHAAKGLEFPVVMVAGGCFGGRGAEGTRVLLDRDQGRLQVALKLEQVGSPHGPTLHELRVATAGHGALVEAEKAMESSERRRLLYVAATRAMDLLVLTLPGWSTRTRSGALLEPLAGELPEPGGVTEAAVHHGAVVAPATRGVAAAAPPPPGLGLPEALHARAAWIAEHQRLTAAAERPLAVTSPSRLEDLEFRELRDHDERVAFAGARRASLALGSAVHQVMEGAPFGADDALVVPPAVGKRIAELAAKAVADTGEAQDTDLSERVADYATACWLSAPVRQAAASSHVHRELPLCVQVRTEDTSGGSGSGAAGAEQPPLVEGFCDLLYRAPDGWVVVDYKTDRHADDQAIRGQYELQAGAYALAVGQITGERVARACFVLAGAAQAGQAAPVVEFPITDDLLGRVRARISEAVSQDASLAD